MWALKELRRSSTAPCTEARSNKICIITGCGRSRQSLNSQAGERWWLLWYSSRWEVLRMKVTSEDLLTAGYTLKNRKVSPGLLISLRAMVSGRLSLPFFYCIGFPWSIVSNWKSPFFSSVFLMTIGFNTYAGFSCSRAVPLESALLLDMTE